MDFLEDYRIYTDPLETPELFNVWSALSALSAAAQRKIWFDGGLIIVCPNLYIATVAPPGEVGKTTGMGIVQEHLVSKVRSIKVNSDSITKEKIFDEMEANVQQFIFPGSKSKALMHCSYTLFANELSVLIKDDRKFVAALTSLFDHKEIFKHSTKHKGVTYVVNPYLNLYGCTTPDWVSYNIHEDILEGGLTARMILLYAGQRSKLNPFPSFTPEMLAARERMIARLEQICQIGGPVVMTPECRRAYDAWYHDYYSKPVNNPKMRGYYNRKRVHVVKVAILLSLARKDSLIIDTSDLDEAFELLKITEPAIEESLSGVGRNILSGPATNILGFVQSQPDGKIELGELYKPYAWQLGLEEFNEVIKSLQLQGFIQVVWDEKSRSQFVFAKGGKK